MVFIPNQMHHGTRFSERAYLPYVALDAPSGKPGVHCTVVLLRPDPPGPRSSGSDTPAGRQRLCPCTLNGQRQEVPRFVHEKSKLTHPLEEFKGSTGADQGSFATPSDHCSFSWEMTVP